MPVPTETFRSVKKLNIVFAVLSSLLMLSTLWFVVTDHNKGGFRSFQKDAYEWRAAYLSGDVAKYSTAHATEMVTRAKEALVTYLAAHPNYKGEMKAIEDELAKNTQKINAIQIKFNVAAGAAGPKAQEVERARTAQDAERAKILKKELDNIVAERDRLAAEIAGYKRKIDEQKEIKRGKIKEYKAINLAHQGTLQLLGTPHQKLLELKPETLSGMLVTFIRDEPLLDWLNPKIKVHQVETAHTLTDYNFVTIKTVDRCKSCHFNIDDGKFERPEMISFLERQLVGISNRDHIESNGIDKPLPVDGLRFWGNAAEKLGLGDVIVNAKRRAFERITLLKARLDTRSDEAKEKEMWYGSKASLGEEVYEELLDDFAEKKWADVPEKARELILGKMSLGFLLAQTSLEKAVAVKDGQEVMVSAKEWHETVNLYQGAIVRAAGRALDKKQFGRLEEQYRRLLVRLFNVERAKHDLPALSESPVMLGHPNFARYVGPESSHEFSEVGCTVCHEGSSQETQFVHTTHTPRDIWVDSQTGMPIPDFQMNGKSGHGESHASAGGGVKLVSHETQTDEHGAEAKGLDQLLQLNAHSKLAPFAPSEHKGHGQKYLDLSSGVEREAVTQEAFWTKKYQWHSVGFDHWPNPMNSMDYIESSCSKCHTEYHDIRDEAPKLMKGRQLFASIGCASCHNVDAVERGLDKRKVGPSLVHVKYKLKKEGMANFIIAPRAFRPMSQMPHLFGLENNSSEIDILRGRVEVAAIATYLSQAKSGAYQEAQRFNKLAILESNKAGDFAKRLKLEQSKDVSQLSEQQRITRAYQLEVLPKKIAKANKQAKAYVAQRDTLAYNLPDLNFKMASLEDAFASVGMTYQQQLAGLKGSLKGASASQKKAVEKKIALTEAKIARAKSGLIGDVATGKRLFNTIGCTSCHMNMNEQGEGLIVPDLMARLHLSKEDAQHKYKKEMSYNQRQYYVKQYLSDQITRTGPEISGVTTKLMVGRGIAGKGESMADAKARAYREVRTWYYDWVSNPKHYSSTTIMPSMRLTTEEALDLSSYLLTLERPIDDLDPYVPGRFMNFDTDAEGTNNRNMLFELVALQHTGKLTNDQAKRMLRGYDPISDDTKQIANAWNQDEQLMFLGKKMISNYGCYNCHNINGFEKTASTCADLDDWGTKDPHKLAFEYFDHAFEKTRQKKYPLKQLAFEGRKANTARITYNGFQNKLKSDGAGKGLNQRAVAWPHIAGDRRSWAVNKLHNPRVYDRGRNRLDAIDFNTPGLFDKKTGLIAFPSSDTKYSAEEFLGKPYDKLKMPKFFLSDDEVQAIVTFVTSLRKPLVTDAIIARASSEKRVAIARGRQVTALFNCTGCHNIEGNTPYFAKFVESRNAETGLRSGTMLLDLHGRYNVKEALYPEALAQAPPRLFGQGGKTAGPWVYNFLHDVQPIRPRLTKRFRAVRMPSFFDKESVKSNDQATAIVNYFASHSQQIHAKLSDVIGSIVKYHQANPEVVNWQDAGPIRSEVAALKKLMVWIQISEGRDLAESAAVEITAEDIADAKVVSQTTWDEGFKKLRIFDAANDFKFPYTKTTKKISDQRFARGELLYETSCKSCHRLGDTNKLMTMFYQQKALTADADAGSGEGEDEGFGEDEDEGEDDGFGEDGDDGDDGFGDDEKDSKVAQAPRLEEGPANVGPNLSGVAGRIKYPWAMEWVRSPQAVLPGTKMSAQFGTLQHQNKFGHTDLDQIQLVLDYVYEAGRRGHTNGEEKLKDSQFKPRTFGSFKDLSAPQMVIPKFEKIITVEPIKVTPKKVETVKPVKAAVVLKKSLIQLHDGEVAYAGGKVQGNVSRLVGVVKYNGAYIKPKKVAMGKDPNCKSNGRAYSFEEKVLINKKDMSLRNAFIYVKKGLPRKSWKVSRDVVVIDQRGCIYVPHVAGAMIKQKVSFLSSDPTSHNVKLTGTGINKTIAPGSSFTTKFKKANIHQIACDVHSWMNGRLHVMKHPFFAVSDVEGRFEILGLPDGTYTLEAIHEDARIKAVSFDVTIKGGRSVRVDDVKMGR